MVGLCQNIFIIFNYDKRNLIPIKYNNFHIENAKLIIPTI